MQKRKLEVSHILYSNLGGASNVVFSLIQQNNQKTYKENLIFTGPKFLKDYKKKANSLNINFQFLKTIKYLHFLSWLNIFNSFKNMKPDIIFIHNYQLIPAIIYKLIFSKKLIYVDHWNANTQKIRKNIIGLLVKLFIEKVVVLNRDNYHFYKKKIKINKSRIFLIPNGIDTKYYSNKRIKKRNNIFKIGMATRLEGIEKIPDLVFEALNTVLLKKYRINFYLAGDGKRKKIIKEKIKNYNLNKSCFINGYLKENDLKNWYKSLDLYVHPTLGEAMSTSILQAMSMNLPVLASDVTGVNNMIGKKKYVGMLFKNNEIDLAKKIEIFYNMNYKLKQKFSKTQKKYLIKNHSSELMFERYKQLILKLLK